MTLVLAGYVNRTHNTWSSGSHRKKDSPRPTALCDSTLLPRHSSCLWDGINVG